MDLDGPSPISPPVSSIAYHVPLAQLEAFRGRILIVRSARPRDLVARLLDDYLHKSTVTQPIEYFHSLLLGFCDHEAINLWAIQEEDPALIRYVDEQGEEHLPGRLIDADYSSSPANFVADWEASLSTEGAECLDCPFFTHCRGYFKWPRRDYDCAGVKTLFTALQQAGGELERDLAAAPPAAGSRR